MNRDDEFVVLWQRARRVVGHAETQRQDGTRVPVDHYLDPARNARERATLRRWPHIACPAAQVRAAGDWTTVDVLGVPMLIARGEDGELRAFLNVCRHRGAAVAAGCGHERHRFVCPYHSWTYDSTGALVGRPQEADFLHAPRDRSALQHVPVTSRCGLVWVVPSADRTFDWDAYFGPMADTLEHLGYDGRCESTHQRAFVQPANWKLLVDGALETYHFQYAHRQSIAPYFHDNAVQQESFGPHQRIVLARKSLHAASQRIAEPTSEQFGRHASLLHFLFPSSFLLWNGDHVTAFAMRPHTIDSAETDSFLLVAPDAFAAKPASHWDVNWQRFWDPLDEDYALGASIQKGLSSSANHDLVFGTNEFAAPLFHAALEESLAQSGA